ncbi:DUF2523 family protein [Noviherbaspirillum sedimenti]|uniref:DUF2523 domain-containing protein n=1 Tax=Noviherbaspirillum sedimenti TaxID=2320865 RepID=A0A3A3G395_9BURK|nr:DUF2523 family protein [Noviherbaspirillum sedimenti]RJG00962.1 DUF2523 domain-containing protein [Noviherbaspirillum sedimenti]
MGAFFTALLAKFSALATWFGNLFKAVFSSLWHLVTDVFCWIFEGLLTLVQTVLDSLPGPDSFSLFNPAQYVTGLPSDLVNMIGLIRVGEALAIILAAILIKLTLQIIPFTRLGS